MAAAGSRRAAVIAVPPRALRHHPSLLLHHRGRLLPLPAARAHPAWFGVAWDRPDVWAALALSLRVATAATAIALVLGTLAALAVHRSALLRARGLLPAPDPAHRPARHRHRHLAALGPRPARGALQHLDHRGRPRDLLRGRGLQQRHRAPAAHPALAGRRRPWTWGPRPSRPSATCCSPTCAPRSWPAACSPSPCPSTRSSSPPSPPASRRPCPSGSSTSSPSPGSGPVTNVVAVFVVAVTALPVFLAHRLTRDDAPHSR